MVASVIMIMGYGIIAVPTGIVTSELSKGQQKPVSTQACPNCGREGHDVQADYCKYCGSSL
jgi:voltage-gated potassium channel